MKDLHILEIEKLKLQSSLKQKFYSTRELINMELGVPYYCKIEVHSISTGLISNEGFCFIIDFFTGEALNTVHGRIVWPCNVNSNLDFLALSLDIERGNKT